MRFVKVPKTFEGVFSPFRGATVRSYPHKMMGMAVTAVLVFVLILASLSSLTWIRDRSATRVQLELERMLGRVAWLDEALTMSAKMGAATGDPRWKSRYDVFDSELAQLLSEAANLAPDASEVLVAREIEEANRALVAMERQAFELAARGERTDASRLLDSSRYEGLKSRYATGMGRFSAEIREQILRIDRSHQLSLGLTWAVTAIAGLVLMLSWNAVKNRVVVWGELLRRRGSVRAQGARFARRRADEAERIALLGESAADIACEIRHPMARTLTLARQLRILSDSGDMDHSRMESALEGIEKNQHRIGRILEGLQAFAADVEADPFEARPLRLLVEETLELIRYRFKAAGFRLEVRYIPDVELECREVQFSQVLLSLLDEAHDAERNSEDRWVRLEFSESSQGLLEIGVAHGNPAGGMSAQGGNSIRQSISRRIIEEHGGELRVLDNEAVVRFTLRLPLRRSQGLVPDFAAH